MAGSGIIKLKYNKHAHTLVNQYIKKYKIIILVKIPFYFILRL